MILKLEIVFMGLYETTSHRQWRYHWALYLYRHKRAKFPLYEWLLCDALFHVDLTDIIELQYTDR